MKEPKLYIGNTTLSNGKVISHFLVADNWSQMTASIEASLVEHYPGLTVEKGTRMAKAPETVFDTERNEYELVIVRKK
jgi:hypothetical protein